MEYSRNSVLKLAFAIEGTAFASALFLAWYFGIGIFPLTEDLFRDIFVGTLGALLPLAGFIYLLSKRAENIPVIGSLRRTMIADIRGIFSDVRLPDIVVIALLAGLGEEVLFRGVLQVKFGIIVASLLFGIVHMITPAYMIATALMGLYMGFFFHLYDSLLIPIQLHFIYDLGALVYLKYFGPSTE